MNLNEIQDIVKNVELGTRHHFFLALGDNMVANQYLWMQTFTNNAVDIMYAQTMIPNDFVEGTLPTVQAVFRTGNTTGNLRYALATQFGAVDENITANQSSVTAVVKAVSVAYLTWVTNPLALAVGLRRDDYIGVKFTRQADSAQDTFEADIYGIGFVITYEGRVK